VQASCESSGPAARTGRTMASALPALVAAAALLVCDAGAAAQSFPKAERELEARLDAALSELADVREGIAREKVPLSRQISRLEAEVVGLRRTRDDLLELRDSRSIDLSSLRKQVESLASQDDFVRSRLNEFARDFEARLDISELPRYEALTSAAQLAEKNVNLDAEARRDAQVAVVRAAIERIEEQLGGHSWAGEALGPDGVLTEGTFVAFGPTVLYASEDGAVAGLVENQLNAADPVVRPVGGGFEEGIAAVARSGTGTLPFDPTLGKALRIEKARKSLRQYVSEGGVVGYVIIGLGLSALAVTLFKAREILGFPVGNAEEVDVVLDELAKGNQEAAAWQAQRVEGVAGEMLTTGVQNADEKRGVLEELLFEKVLRVRPTLERFLPFLAITAAAAPLLGLLGTVIGMIRTFQLITIFGTGDAKSLSSGISEALITTALGLIVAIPVLILHGALSRLAKRRIGMLEELAVGFVNGVAAIRHDLPGGQGAGRGPRR